jgi:hypothetical protein
MTMKRLGGCRQAPIRSTMLGCRSSLQEEEEEEEEEEEKEEEGGGVR